MLRRRKRIFSNFLITKPLTSHHLLHSDKSTYFYKNHYHTFHPKSQGNAQVGNIKLSVFSSRFQVIPLAVSVAALLGLGVALVNPLAKSAERVYAEDTSELNQYSSIAVSMSNSSLGELTGGETVSAKVTPGLISYIDNNIKITTKRINQFYVTVQATENSASELVGEAYNATIDPVADGVKPDSFSNNTWGYTIGDPEVANEDLTYHPLTQYSAAATPLYTSASNLADGEYNLKLVFAAKINANKPGDHYKTSTLVSVAADARELTLMDINYMQDMTSDICNATSAPTAEDIKNKTYAEIVAATPSKQLKDSRDGKYYWVSKLADGNCWMTQNLDFDVPTVLNTDGITSDIGTANFTTETTKVETPNRWSASAGFNYNAYYNPGDYVYNGPNNTHEPGTECNITGTDTLSSCDQFATTIANTSTSGGINAHYHVGNYYSFSAATAKSADNITIEGIPAPSSVCPKGWKMPTLDNKNGQIRTLLTEYGVNRNLTNGDYAIHKAPLYFTYGGHLSSGGKLQNAGEYGRYWVSTVSSDIRAFALYIDTSVYPAGDARFIGNCVRCIAE